MRGHWSISARLYGLSHSCFRKKEGDKPAQFDDHPVLEMTWTVLFAVILAVMAIPATFTMIRAYDDAEGDINILITGHQWKWQYEYLEDEVSFSVTYPQI